MKLEFSFVSNAHLYLHDRHAPVCFFFFDLSVSPTLSLVEQSFYRLLDCIQYVIVKGTLANCDIIFLGWTGKQKDKPTLLKYMVVAK